MDIRKTDWAVFVYSDCQYISEVKIRRKQIKQMQPAKQAGCCQILIILNLAKHPFASAGSS